MSDMSSSVKVALPIDVGSNDQARAWPAKPGVVDVDDIAIESNHRAASPFGKLKRITRTSTQIEGRMSLKHSFRCLFTVCLIWFGVLAASSVPACAQTGGTPIPVTESSQVVPIFPKYIVMGVVYAPPGAASNVTYGGSTQVGSTDAFSNTGTGSNTNTTSTTSGFNFLGIFGASDTYTTTNEWTEAINTNSSIAVQSTQNNSISTMGPISSSLGVNHDNDVIYIWLNPVVTTEVTGYTGNYANVDLNWTGLSANSCDLTDSADGITFYQAVSGCDPDQYPGPDVVGIPVWCLKNPYYPGQGCAQWLEYTSRPWDTSYWGPKYSGQTNLTLPSALPGLTLQDYADILQADPFVRLNSLSRNVCHPTYGPNVDPNDPEVIPYPSPAALPSPLVNPTGNLPKSCLPNGILASTTINRFQPYGTIEYPVPGPDGLPSTYAGSFQYSQTVTEGTVSTDTHTTGQSENSTASFTATYTDELGIPLASIDSSTSSGSGSTWTWQNQSSTSRSNTNSSSAGYSITGPQLSDNYTGPSTYNVYLDNIYGTFAFYSPLDPPIVPPVGTSGAQEFEIGISPASLSFPSTPVAAITPFAQSQLMGYPAADELQVTLTNNSPYPLTMVGPAVTFTDPGFIIANDGTDYCSDKQLQPYSAANTAQGTDYCTLNVAWVPVVSDAPSIAPYLGSTVSSGIATFPLTSATMIAAGTENASPYQNILVTNTIPVSGTAETGTTTQGATLFPSSSNICQTETGAALNPNACVLPQLSVGSSELQQFTFTNYNSSSVTFPANPQDFALSDSSDFSIVPGTDGCAGATVNPPTTGGVLSTCTAVLKYAPVPGGIVNTRITAMGTVGPVAGSATGIVSLAFAGAMAAYPPGSVQIPSSQAWTAITEPCYPPSGSSYCTYNYASLFGITNSGGNPVTLGESATGGFSVVLNGTVNSEPNGGNLTANCPTSLAIGSYCTAIVVGPTSGLTNYSTATGTVTITGGTAGSATMQVSQYNNYSSTDSVVVIHGAEQSTQVTTPATSATGSLTITSASGPSNGALSVQVGSFKAAVPYAAGATNSAVLQDVANALNAAGSPVKATANGSSIALTSLNSGAAGDLALSVTGGAAFQLGASGKTLTGGTNAIPATNATGSIAIRPVSAGAPVEGTLPVQVGSFKAVASYPAGATPGTIAHVLAAALNGNGSPVKATASGTTISLTSQNSGAAGDLALVRTGDSEFVVGVSGRTLSGGSNEIPATNATGNITIQPEGTTAATKGTLSVQVGAFRATAPYAAGATASAVVKGLVAALNVPGSPVKATASGNVISLTSTSSGTAANLALTGTGDLKFALNASGKTLTGGKNLVAATSATGSLSVELAGGTLSVQLGAFKATVPHTPGAATGAVVENLVQALNATGSPVKATASGDLISLVSKSTGTAANLAFTVTGDSKFVLSGSGKALTGGKAEVAATNATGSLSAGLKGGILSLQVGAFKAEALYAAGEPTGAVIQALVRAINVAGSPVRAAENGNVISLTSSSAGTAGNLALTVTGDARFAMVASGPALTGGKNATTTTNYDAGVVQLTTNGVTASATWAEGSTAETVAAALAGSVNQVAAAYYQASSSGAVVTLTPVSSKSSASTAANTSNPISLTVNDSAGFTPASFGAAMN